MTDDPQALFGIAEIETALAGIEAVVNANNVLLVQIRQEIKTMSDAA